MASRQVFNPVFHAVSLLTDVVLYDYSGSNGLQVTLASGRQDFPINVARHTAMSTRRPRFPGIAATNTGPAMTNALLCQWPTEDDMAGDC